MSYPTEVTTVLIVALAVIVLDLVARTILKRERPKRKEFPPSAPFFRWLRVVVNVAGVAALFAVSWTAMSALMANENRLTGDRLISHVTMAPVFATAAVLVALFWAHRNRLAADDWVNGWALPLRKLFFWLAVALAIPTFVSIVAAMYPITDTDGQETLIRIHRYCGPLLAGAGVLFAYFALVSWRERSRD